jgi:2-C-methyl-D-erythritol 4-phosphate cytidylyltransferase
MTHSLIAIVPAAGVGARAAHPESAPLPKQYRLLAGEPMLRHTVRSLLADDRICEVRVAVAAEDDWVGEALADLPRTVWRRCGGPTRAETVAAALNDTSIADDSWVLVHDAARPGLPASALTRLIDACLDDAVGGLLAMPVADTVKAGDSRVARTIDRAGLWLAQTPQMFRAGMLRRALAQAANLGVAITDEASAIEGAGHAPRLVLGSARNFKVTWPEDFELMEKWL